jgi:hypothetical protein
MERWLAQNPLKKKQHQQQTKRRMTAYRGRAATEVRVAKTKGETKKAKKKCPCFYRREHHRRHRQH